MKTLIASLILTLSPTLALATTHPIPQVATDVVAFVGHINTLGASQISGAPLDTPIFVDSMEKFKRRFPNSDLTTETPLQLKAYFENGGTRAYVVRTKAAGVGSLEERTGVYALANESINMIVMPDLSLLDERAYADAVTELLTYARDHSAFAILDAPTFKDASIDPIAQITEWRRLHVLPSDIASFGAMYYPRFTTSGVGGAIAGIYANTDQNEGVWTAPIGAVMGDYQLAADVRDEDASRLYPFHVNSIRMMPGQPVTPWGIQTLSDETDSSKHFVMTKRLMMMIEQSLKNGLAWVAFEPNQPSTWASIQSSVSNFLVSLYQQGALVGNNAYEAFQVQCSLGTTMTSEDILNGIVRVSILVAPTHVAEFELLTLEMQAGQ